MFRTHAQERAHQRYNKELNELDLHNIKKIIQTNQHTPLGCTEMDKNKKFCYVVYNHIPYKILYKISKKVCHLITIYPFDVDEYNIIQEQKKQEKIKAAINLLQTNGYKVIKE